MMKTWQSRSALDGGDIDRDKISRRLGCRASKLPDSLLRLLIRGRRSGRRRGSDGGTARASRHHRAPGVTPGRSPSPGYAQPRIPKTEMTLDSEHPRSDRRLRNLRWLSGRSLSAHRTRPPRCSLGALHDRVHRVWRRFRVSGRLCECLDRAEATVFAWPCRRVDHCARGERLAFRQNWERLGVVPGWGVDGDGPAAASDGWVRSQVAKAAVSRLHSRQLGLLILRIASDRPGVSNPDGHHSLTLTSLAIHILWVLGLQ